MKIFPVILACRGPEISTGGAILLFSLAAIWLAAIVLAFVNMILLVTSNSNGRFEIANFCIFLIYVIPTIALFCGAFNEIAAIVIPIFGFPIFSISHFVYLLCARRKLRKQKSPIEDKIS